MPWSRVPLTVQALQVAAFTRILSWQRIASATNDPASHESLEANIEWFLEHVASS